MIPAGPGKTLEDFCSHLKDVHRRGLLLPRGFESAASRREATPTQPVINVASITREALGAFSEALSGIPARGQSHATIDYVDPIVAFLTEQGLPAEFAPCLAAVGVSAGNLHRLGALPDRALDRLERGLQQEGLSLVDCLLVVESLRRKAVGWDSVM